jgi:signal transduction histidine kinase
MQTPRHSGPNMKAVAPSPASGGAQLPLPGRQFQRYMLAFHIVFLGALAMILANRWQRPGFAWSWREWALVGSVLAQAGLYLRFMAFAQRWPRHWLGWVGYLAAGFVLWFICWRIEPAFEWFVLAYLGQMFGVLPPRMSLPFGGVVFLVYLPVKIGWARLAHLNAQEWVGYLALVIGWSALGLFLHKLATTSAERAELITKLQGAQRELELARARDAELAVLRERERLARDLHDSLGHGLVTLTVQLEAAQRLYIVDPARASALLDDMKTLTRTTMEQLRRSLAGLRAPGLGERPLAQAIAELCTEVADRAGCKVDYQAPAEAVPLPPAVAEALWRTAQEALANVEKHSRAKTARVTLEPGPCAAAVRVTDDGVGLPEEAEARPGHYGLRGLRERVEGLGGAFTAVRSEPAGTTIETRIPLITA